MERVMRNTFGIPEMYLISHEKFLVLLKSQFLRNREKKQIIFYENHLIVYSLCLYKSAIKFLKKYLD